MLLVSQLIGFGATTDVVAGGFSNLKSLKVFDSAGDVLSRTQGAGASRRKMTFSFLARTDDVANVQIAITGDVGGGADSILWSAGTGGIAVVFGAGGASGAHAGSPGGGFANNTWYHVVVQIDTAQAVSTNRCKIYINNTLLTGTELAAVTLNFDTFWGSNGTTENVCFGDDVTNTLVDELVKIDNQILAPTSFATSNLPIDISALTFGSQGYWLRFETGVGSTAGTDSSGNGLTFTSTYDTADFSSTVP